MPIGNSVSARQSDECMATALRIERISQLLREEVTRITDREVEAPDGAMITITRVGVSPDALHATVFFSVLGAGPKDALAVLQKNIYHIQQMLNRRLRMRPVPKIRFAPDEEEARRERVEKFLAAVKKEQEK